MDTKTVMLVLAIAGAAYYFWKQHQAASYQQAVASDADTNGFFALPPPAGVDPHTVLILAAPNCPKAGARRAAALAEALRQRGIPYAQSGQIRFVASPGHIPNRHRLDSVMGGPTPIVIVHGRGKANPTLDEVVAEYHRQGVTTDSPDAD